MDVTRVRVPNRRDASSVTEWRTDPISQYFTKLAYLGIQSGEVLTSREAATVSLAWSFFMTRRFSLLKISGRGIRLGLSAVIRIPERTGVHISLLKLEVAQSPLLDHTSF